LFVAPVLVPLVVMMLLATVTPMFVTNSGQSAWFVGVMVLMSI
jgi:Ca2+:H+ antiporter